MAHFKFKPGQVLVSDDEEIIIVLDTFVDAHTYEKDYRVETIKSGNQKARKPGALFFVDKSILESWFKEANAAQQVLYGH